MSLNPAVKGTVNALVFDAGPSVVAFFVCQLLGTSLFISMLAAALVSGARLVWTAARERRLDPFALFLLVIFGTGLVLSLISGDPRFMVAKESATAVMAGVAFLVSVAIGQPLSFHAAKRFARQKGGIALEQFRSMEHDPVMRARWRRVSLVWGAGLIVQAAVGVALIYLLPLTVAADLSQILSLVTLVVLGTWTILSAKRMSSTDPAAPADTDTTELIDTTGRPRPPSSPDHGATTS